MNIKPRTLTDEQTHRHVELVRKDGRLFRHETIHTVRTLSVGRFDPATDKFVMVDL